MMMNFILDALYAMLPDYRFIEAFLQACIWTWRNIWPGRF